jgi:hypothetical protein
MFYDFMVLCFTLCFCDPVTFFPLHISCVMVPIGQYTHHERGLNKIMVTKPSTVEVSMTL